MSGREDDKHWHLDRKVPLALIFAILGQTAAGIWWASTISSRVDYAERRLEAMAPQADRVTRVEVKIEGVQSDVSEIKQDVKRLLSK
jgi:hypothetical protein